MSLQSFVSQQRRVLKPLAEGDSLIEDFVRVGRPTGVQAVAVTEEIVPEKQSLWQRISKQLMKPVGIVAAETENLGLLLSRQKAQIPGKAGLDVLSGKREYSFSELWRDYGKQAGMDENVAGKIGFVLDIVDDPFNFIGGGLTKLGKLATKVSSLKKAGKPIIPGSKIAKQIAKSGYTADELVLAGNKAEQVAKGQRAILQVVGKPIVGGTKVYKATEKLSQMMKASKAGITVRRTFSTRTGKKEVDELVQQFNNLSGYRKDLVIEQAAKIQKQMGKMKTDEVKLMVEAIENPTAKANVTNKTVLNMANDMEKLFKDMKVAEREVGVLRSEIDQYFPHIKAQESLGRRINAFFNPQKYSTFLGAAKQRKIPGTISDIETRLGREFFETNPALAYAQRGLASAKAVTAKQFLDDVGKRFFVNAENAPISFIESANPIFKGLKADPEIVRVVDQYIQGIQPEELKLLMRAHDQVLNWWKAQVLISPSYHIRNMFSNFWNNWLAGVKNPALYTKARGIQSGKGLDKVALTTDAGEKLTRGKLLKEVKETQVMGRGLYGAEIKQALDDKIGAISQRAKKIGGWMPWRQDNVLFKTNRAVGSAIEDNARIAHYLHFRQLGFSPTDAARSVKKFLFDYGDLSQTERNLFKRFIPFYTWSRKNIPLQLEQLIMQPEKFAAIPKAIKEIEAGSPEPKTEKYLSEYITENVPVRIRTNEKGNVEYFLLGNWLPSAQAIDVLSQPLDNLVNMVTPLLKVPFEIWANKSLFFRNTLGEPSKIEYYYKQPTEFIGMTMRRKQAHLLRNVRILNDLNKLIQVPSRDEPENSWAVKLLNVLFGKAATYDLPTSRFFYQRETQKRINELEASIKRAKRLGDKGRARELAAELKEFRKLR